MNYGAADEEYIIKTVANHEEVDRLKAAIQAEEEAMRKQIATIGAHNTAQIQADAAVRQHAASLKTLGAELSKAQSGIGMTANKMQNMARLLDDAQYIPTQGLRSVANNLVELNPILGAVAIGAQVLISTWDSWKGVIGYGETMTEAERMEALAKATSHTVEETRKLIAYKQQAATIAGQETVTSEAQQDQGKAVRHAIGEAGYDDVVQGVNDTMGDTLVKRDKEARGLETQMKARQAKVEGRFSGSSDNPAVLKQLAKERAEALEHDDEYQGLKDKLKARRLQLAKEYLADAETDSGKLESLHAMAKDKPEAFGPKGEAFGAEIGAQTQSAKEHDAEIEDNVTAREREDAAWIAGKPERKRKAKEAEDAKKKAEDAKKKADEEAERARQKAHREGVADAKHAGIGDSLVGMFEQHLANGGDPAAAEAQMKRQLRGQLGSTVAAEVVNDASSQASRNAYRKAFQGDPAKFSQVTSSADFANKIQAGVSSANDPAKLGARLDKLVQLQTQQLQEFKRRQIERTILRK